MRSFLVVLVFLDFTFFAGTTTGPPAKLAELPLNKLLNVKQALASDFPKLFDGADDQDDNDGIVEIDTEDEHLDGAMPLKGDWFQQKKSRNKPTKLPDRRGDWDYEKGDKKDLSKIFQTTITVLAFLAFGGYLLCVILMSLRNNQGFLQLFPGATTTTPAGRHRRQAFLNEDSPLIDSLTESLHRLAEGYAKYHFQDTNFR